MLPEVTRRQQKKKLDYLPEVTRRQQKKKLDFLPEDNRRQQKKKIEWTQEHGNQEITILSFLKTKLKKIIELIA